MKVTVEYDHTDPEERQAAARFLKGHDRADYYESQLHEIYLKARNAFKYGPDSVEYLLEELEGIRSMASVALDED